MKNVPELADYYEGIFKVSQSRSHQLGGGGELLRDSKPLSFNKCELVLPRKSYPSSFFDDISTFIFPTTSNLLDSDENSQIIHNYCEHSSYKPVSSYMMSPYLNIPDDILSSLKTHLKETPITVITASLQSNGFAGAKGILKHIPAIYQSLTQSLLRKEIRPTLLNDSVLEFHKPGWSFHGKGIAFQYERFSAHFLGSPNFGIVPLLLCSYFCAGYRSTYTDVENQVCILSGDNDLCNRLGSVNRCLIFSTT